MDFANSDRFIKVFYKSFQNIIRLFYFFSRLNHRCLQSLYISLELVFASGRPKEN